MAADKESAMTPERLQFLVEDCFHRKQRRPGETLEAQYLMVARFLDVDPQTLRRWRAGLRPIPRAVEVVMEIFYAYPQVTADAVNNIIRARDDKASKA
jgi:hypothetical protein